MEATKQMFFDRINDFIIECNITSYKRLCTGYDKMSCWLRNNDLETPFLKLRTSFSEMRNLWELHGITEDLTESVNDIATKAKFLAEDATNTKIVGIQR